MKELEALHEAGLSESDEDPFDKVMETNKKKRMQLHGRVSLKTLKEKGIREQGGGKSVVLPQEYVDAMKSSLQAEMQKDFEIQKEKMALEMKQQFEDEKGKMVDDVVAKALIRLKELCPNVTNESLGRAIATSLLDQ